MRAGAAVLLVWRHWEQAGLRVRVLQSGGGGGEGEGVLALRGLRGQRFRVMPALGGVGGVYVQGKPVGGRGMGWEGGDERQGEEERGMMRWGRHKIAPGTHPPTLRTHCLSPTLLSTKEESNPVLH